MQPSMPLTATTLPPHRLFTLSLAEARSVSIEKSENGLRLCLEQMRSDISAIWSMCDA